MRMTDKFIADVHLGKLARLLRLLGFDTHYENNSTINELLSIGTDQDRIILSRNSLISKKTNKSFIVTDENPFTQWKEVDEHFHLRTRVHPFSRCIVCNGVFKTVLKENIVDSLEINTASYFNEFWQCQECIRIYWKGSHYERMLKTIQNITARPL